MEDRFLVGVGCATCFFSLSRWLEPLVLLWATSTRDHISVRGPDADIERSGIEEQTTHKSTKIGYIISTLFS